MSERPFKLHSVADVLALWPEGSRPGERLLRSKARATGHCRILGKSIAFTDADIDALIAELSPCSSSSGFRNARRTGTSGGRSKEGRGYLKARARLIELTQKSSATG